MRQTQIPGTAPPDDPPRNPELDLAIERQYERRAALKLAREVVSIGDAKLMELVEALGQPYPFLEPGTGRRKVLRLDAKKQLKSEAQKPAKQEQADREWAQQQAEARGGATAELAESVRQLKERGMTVTVTAGGKSVDLGAAVEKGKDEADPFAATRAAMAAPPADETPAQAAVREAEEGRAARRAARKDGAR